ncbi:MAG: ATP-grasp domain-containing protein [candidate division KSB1 bacterium]|nr:ATP-grasp domain-containing protein [candidate division KSB1 bacterium]
MKVAIIYNKDIQGVINQFGMQNKEFYNERTVNRVAASLEKSNHNVMVLDGNKQIVERLETFMPRVMEGEQMGMVFNMAYGIQGESRYTHIPSMLEMLGVPYVGSSPSGHALALDKVLTKIIWKSHSLPTPDFWVFNSADQDMSMVKYPVIVKPKMESVSFGLRIVDNDKDLKQAVQFIIAEYSQNALVEQFIPGREFIVGLLGNSPLETFPILEIDLQGDRNAIQTMDDKQKVPREKICPAHVSPEVAEKMQKLSVQAFKALDLRDFARVDIRLDQHDNIYLLEINSMASLGQSGSYPAAARVAGYSYEALVNKMLDVASVRYFSDSLHHVADEKSSKSLAVRMRSFIKTRQTQTEMFLKKIIDTNTHIRNVDGVNFCSEIISSELSQLGFNREVYPQLEVGNLYYFSNTYDKVDYLLLLSLDNRVKLADQENFSSNEQYLEGTGIWESKGGIAIVVSALRTLRFTRLLRKKKIGILLITDSTIDGKYSKTIIQQKAAHAEKIIAMSGSSRSGGLVTSRSGSASYRYDIKLTQRNSAEQVSMAGVAFNKTLAAIIDLSKNDSENVIAPYDIQFKSNIFKVFAYGTAGISVRYNSKEIFDIIEKRIKKITSTQKRNKIYQVHFEGGSRRPAMPETEAMQKFYQDIKRLSKSIDVRTTKEHRWSSSDICHIQSDQPKIDGMGPTGEFITTTNERILKHSLIDRSLLLALVLGQ